MITIVFNRIDYSQNQDVSKYLIKGHYSLTEYPKDNLHNYTNKIHPLICQVYKHRIHIFGWLNLTKYGTHNKNYYFAYLETNKKLQNINYTTYDDINIKITQDGKIEIGKIGEYKVIKGDEITLIKKKK